MNIYNIEQKIIGFKQMYSIYNQDSTLYLQVTYSRSSFIIDRILGGILSIGCKLNISDLDGNEYVTIKKYCGVLLEKYDIFYDGIKIAQIKQLISATKPKFIISTENNTYEINGDIMAKDFTVIKDGISLAKISKRRFNVKDRYKLEIFKLDYEKVIIASVICIDNSIHN